MGKYDFRMILLAEPIYIQVVEALFTDKMELFNISIVEKENPKLYQ
ncbi:MAG: hypothetical protein J6L77_11030 [Coprococcus sp.]|nr:hypothetical protein [Coprococcus sp.]